MNKRLISSILTITLCLSMIAGSTFALFTSEDSVNVAVNAAKVNVVAEVGEFKTYSMSVAQPAGTFENGGTAKYNSETGVFDLVNIAPGDKVEFPINIKNNSNIDIQYRVKWTVEGELLGALVATVDDVTLATTTSEWALWTTKDAAEKTLNVSIELPVDKGDEYQEKSAKVAFVVEAIQGNAIVKDVQTADQLMAAIEAGVDNITLTENITLNEGDAIEIPADAEITLNLNGKTISGNKAKTDDKNEAVLVNNGVLTLKDGTVENSVVNGNAAIVNTGTLVLDGVIVVGAGIGETGYPSYAINTSGELTIEDGTSVSSDRGCIAIIGAGKTTINGGTFTNNDIDVGLTSHVVDVSDDAAGHVLTINGGTFSHLDGETSGGVVICNRTKGTVYVNGGTFSGGNYYGDDNLSDYGYRGTFSVTGGNFTAKPADNYLAEGYTALKDENNGIYVVTKDDRAIVNVDGVGSVIVPEEVSADEVLVIPSETTDLNEALKAKIEELLADNQDAIYIATPGDYNLPDNLRDKTIMIAGTEDVNVGVMDDGSYEGCDYSLDGATVVFDGITITTDGSTYSGYARLNATYNNCVINNTYTLYGKSVFNNCTFNVSGDYYNIWTWGAPTAEFNNCTFNTSGKALLLYGGNDTVLTVNNCVFNDDDAYADVNNKAAIEVGSDWSTDEKTIIANNVTVNGFDVTTKGTSTGTTLYGDKNDLFVKGRLTVTIDGVTMISNGFGTDAEGNFYAYNAKGLAAMHNELATNSDFNQIRGKSYNLLADIDANGYEWSSVTLNTGSVYNEGITFNGNGHTISNMVITGGGMFNRNASGSQTEGCTTIKALTLDNAAVTGGYHVGAIWGQMYGYIVLDDVHVINSSITGTCNVGALIGRNGDDGVSKITFTDCSVENTTVTSIGGNGVDNCGASAFLGSALKTGIASVVLTFTGENTQSGNTLTSASTQQGGGIYACAEWGAASWDAPVVVNDYTNYDNTTN